MNKTAIKNYAIWARVQLIEAAKQRAYEYEITDGGENKSGLDTIGGRLLSKTEKEQRNQLIAEINQKGFSQVMEEAAYTWFNRFIALRFMEVNGYMPSKVRVFTDENGFFKPEILKQAVSVELEGLDRSKVLDLLDKQNNEELFKYLIITQCNALNVGLPYMFEKIGGWTELLFPANLLRQDSVIGQMISEIPEEDWTDAVQIIGWMYQYYNSELKDETFALLKKNVKIAKDRIPAATQLFTPDWIVRYMVENSLGHLWLKGHSDFDKSHWKYYVDESEQDPEVEAQLQKIRAEYSSIKPEEIKVIDPCMGSGHILVYAFDVLMQIYTSAGWSERDAAKSIIENNLYGLDIDNRAGQLAYFAVMMKARKHSRRILNGDVKPNVFSIQDSNWMTDEFIAYVAEKDATIKADLIMLRKTFRDAKEYGSILNVPTMQYDALYERINIIGRSYAENLFQAQYRMITSEFLLPLVKQSQIMSQKYDVVITNPPYMGASGMNDKLSSFIKEYYLAEKGDLYTVFIGHNTSMLKPTGVLSMITQHTWMYTSSYEDLRKSIVSKMHIASMIHLGAHAFEEIGGEVVQTVAFSMDAYAPKGQKGSYFRLTDYGDQDAKEQAFLAKFKQDMFYSSETNYMKITGSPIAYWASDKVCQIYESAARIDNYGSPKQGLATGSNDDFLRAWFEIDINKACFDAVSIEDAKTRSKKWFPYNKGGENKKWYGNNYYVVNWENDGYLIKHFTDSKGKLRSRPQNLQFFFKPCCTWSLTSSGEFGARIKEPGFIFDINGMSLFTDDKYRLYMLGFLCSKVCTSFMRINNPSLASQSGDIAKLPFIYEEDKNDIVSELVSKLCELTKEEFDESETSWNFKQNPLV